MHLGLGRLGLGKPRSREKLPEAPEGFAYLVNAEGKYIVNADGAYILAKV